MELEASKLQVEYAQKEKQRLFDQVRTTRMLMESVEAQLMEEMEKARQLELEEC
jgi:hypothetical protein